MKIVVCGAGNIAQRVIELFKRTGDHVTIVTLSTGEHQLNRFREYGIPVIVGDARERETMLAADVGISDAVLALVNDEVTNLEIAILARELNPGARIIARMFDEKISVKITKGFHIDRMLSVSFIAAASFVSSCIDEHIQHTLTINERAYYIINCHVDDECPYNGKSIVETEKGLGINIIATHDPAGDIIGDDRGIVCTGKRILFVSTDRKAVKVFNGCGEMRPEHGELRIIKRRSIADLIRSIPANVRLIGALYTGVIMASTIIFNIFMDLSILDSLYFTITTTTTVGYGDYNLQQSPPGVKLFGMLVMVFGAAVLAAIFSVITDALIGKRLNRYFGLGKSRMKNHIVIAGLGSIGCRVINLLLESGEKVIAVEKNSESEFLPLLRERVPVLFGNALHDEIMTRAGIQNAKAVMALTDDDLVNLNVLLNARELNPSISTIARIFNRNISDKAGSAFGINSVMSTSLIAAPVFAVTAIAPDALYAFLWGDTLYGLIELKHDEKERLKGLGMKDTAKEHGLYPLIYINDTGEHGFITHDYRIRNDDRLIVLGSYVNIKRFFDIV